MDFDLPIALRRTRRSTASHAPAAGGATSAHATAAAKPQPNGGTDFLSPPATPSAASVRTPARRAQQPLRSKKRVRFSDPGPLPADADAEAPAVALDAGTGLTPMVRRTSLGTPSKRSRSGRRRHSTPGLFNGGADGGDNGHGQPRRSDADVRFVNLDDATRPFSGEVSFLPLRQVLDGRIKRRLRRNGLSEEMNSIYAERAAEKRTRAAAAAASEAELARLRADVAAKDAEIARLQAQGSAADAADDTIFQDNERVLALETEVATLRRQLVRQQTEAGGPGADRTFNWTMAARDPFASTLDDDMTETMTDIMEDDDGMAFGDMTVAELQCSTPSRVAKRGPPNLNDSQMTISMHGGGSFPTPPASSPSAWIPEPISPASMATAPTTPVTPSMFFFRTAPAARKPSSPPAAALPPPSVAAPATAEAQVQASLPDPEAEQLREEAGSLRREMARLRSALEAYQALAQRLAKGLSESAAEAAAGPEAPAAADPTDLAGLEARVTLLCRALSDKTVALAELSKGLATLGFSGTGVEDASGVIASLAAACRTARLELEYLTPGEIELPLTAPVAQVLDLLLTRLRALSQQARAADAQIDEYHEIEQGLRQQLGARVDAMDDLAKQVATLQQAAADKDAALADKDALLASQGDGLADLQVGLDRLKGAMASYARDVAELEALVQRLEGELAAKTAEVAALNQGHGRALALRDARVQELREEIEQVNSALRAAHDTARQLRVENAGLGAALGARDAETQRAQNAVATLQAELVRVGQLGQELLAAGASGVSRAQAAEETALAKRMTPGRRRRLLSLGRRSSGARSGRAGEGPTEAATGESRDGEADSAAAASDAAAESRSKRRRRYDSGLGFLDEEEAGVEA